MSTGFWMAFFLGVATTLVVVGALRSNRRRHW